MALAGRMLDANESIAAVGRHCEAFTSKVFVLRFTRFLQHPLPYASAKKRLTRTMRGQLPHVVLLRCRGLAYKACAFESKPCRGNCENLQRSRPKPSTEITPNKLGSLLDATTRAEIRRPSFSAALVPS